MPAATDNTLDISLHYRRTDGRMLCEVLAAVFPDGRVDDVPIAIEPTPPPEHAEENEEYASITLLGAGEAVRVEINMSRDADVDLSKYAYKPIPAQNPGTHLRLELPTECSDERQDQLQRLAERLCTSLYCTLSWAEDEKVIDCGENCCRVEFTMREYGVIHDTKFAPAQLARSVGRKLLILLLVLGGVHLLWPVSVLVWGVAALMVVGLSAWRDSSERIEAADVDEADVLRGLRDLRDVQRYAAQA
jgi:hypothetical protein